MSRRGGEAEAPDPEPSTGGTVGVVRWADVVTFTCVWLLGSIAVGAGLWPMTHLSLTCYLQESDLDLIGIGATLAAFAWLLAAHQFRLRVGVVSTLLVLLVAADYVHLGGMEFGTLIWIEWIVLIPVVIYIWLFDQAEIFDSVAVGGIAIQIGPFRKLFREKLPFMRRAPGMAAFLLVLTSITVLAVAHGAVGAVPALWGSCPSSH